MGLFIKPEDVANRAIQHVGARRILTLADNSKQAAEVNFCYDKLRVAELRRSVWRFATRRAMLRPLSGTSLHYTPPIWSNVTAYVPTNIVMDSTGIFWICMVPNTGKTPGAAPDIGIPPYWQQYFGPVVSDLWASGNTYNSGELAHKVGPVFYISGTNNNTNQDPASGNPWIPLLGTTNQSIILPEPAGVSMTVNTRARNAFPLPNGYLRVAGPDPKVESTSTLQTSGALRFSDWQFEGNYIISASTTPLLLRFVADVADVTAMDPLFCELLAARIAYEICEPLTQSNVKLQAIASAYQKFAKDARLINWIETGTTEPQEEEYELTKGPAGVQETPNQSMQSSDVG